MEREAWHNGNLVYPTDDRESWANGDLVFPTETGVTPVTPSFIPKVIWFMLLMLMFCLSGCISYKCNQTTFNAEATGIGTEGKIPAITQESGNASLEAAADLALKADATVPMEAIKKIVAPEVVK